MRRAIEEANRRNKVQYDKKAFSPSLQVGDEVAVRHPWKRVGVAGKLQDSWITGCRVTRKVSDHTYLCSDGKTERAYHRNNLRLVASRLPALQISGAERRDFPSFSFPVFRSRLVPGARRGGDELTSSRQPSAPRVEMPSGVPIVSDRRRVDSVPSVPERDMPSRVFRRSCAENVRPVRQRRPVQFLNYHKLGGS